MAEKVITILIDDTDGSDAEGTVSFTLRGRTTEIDLSEANTDILVDVLRPYLQSGRLTKTVPFQSRAKGTEKPQGVYITANNKTKRAWARSNGWKIKPQGRIPNEVSEAFDAAQSSRISGKL